MLKQFISIDVRLRASLLCTLCLHTYIFFLFRKTGRRGGEKNILFFLVGCYRKLSTESAFGVVTPYSPYFPSHPWGGWRGFSLVPARHWQRTFLRFGNGSMGLWHHTMYKCVRAWGPARGGCGSFKKKSICVQIVKEKKIGIMLIAFDYRNVASFTE